jgi:hypothetical protein
VRANYVVVTNSGDPAEIWTPIMERLLALQGTPVFSTTRLILARNPAFYTVKKHLLRAKGNQLWPTYNINAPWQAVGRLWPVETVSFASTFRLERKLRKLGMRRSAIKGVLRLVREADRHRLEPRLFIGEWKLRRYRPAPAARALWAAAAGALAGSGAIYSMTRSASSSNEFGICMPICCAACRLITSSKRVGSSTGRVAGSAPLAILST